MALARSITVLAGGFARLEGPVVEDSGAIVFTDLIGGVYRLLPGGALETVLPGRTMVGGVCLHADGGLVVSGESLLHLDGDRQRVLLALSDLPARAGSRAVGFNDIEADPDGNVVAGVLRKNAAGDYVPGELVRVTAEHELSVLHDDVTPNGIAFSPDGARLYCADTFRRRVLVLRRPEPSSFSTEAVPGRPDGVAVDEEGCLWIAFWNGGCVACFTPDGALLERIELAGDPRSLCFQPGRRELYVVTAQSAGGGQELDGSVLRVEVDVRGAPRSRARI